MSNLFGRTYIYDKFRSPALFVICDAVTSHFHVFIQPLVMVKRLPDVVPVPKQIIQKVSTDCVTHHIATGVNFEIVRSQMNVSVEFVQKETSLSAFRASFGNPPTVEKFKGFTFPSGMAFGIDS